MAIEKQKWFQIKMEGDMPEITINKYIGDDEGDTNYDSFIDSLNTLKNGGTKKCRMIINCAGGDMFNGFAIHDAANASGIKFEKHIIGMAASMGGVLAQIGDDKPFIHPNAFYMIHEPQMGEFGTSAALRAMADLGDQMKERVIELFTKVTGAPADEVKSWVKPEAKWINAKKAISMGLCQGFSNQEGLAGKAPDVKAMKPKEIWAIYNKLIDNTTPTKTNTMILPKNTAKQLALKADEEYTDAEIQMAVNKLHERAKTAETKLEELNDSIEEEKEKNATKMVNAVIKAKKATEEEREDLMIVAKQSPVVFNRMFSLKPANGDIINKLSLKEDEPEGGEDDLEKVKMSTEEKELVEGDKPYTALMKYKGGKLLAKIKKEAPNLYKDICMRTYNKVV